MKKAFILFLLLSVSLAGCRMRGHAPVRETDAPAETATDTLEPDYVLCSHVWKDLDTSVYLGRVPTREEIERWKREFETANTADTLSMPEIWYFNDMSHYMAIMDCIELWHRDDAGVPDSEQAQWRLLQWDPELPSMPKAGFGRVRYIRDQIGRLMQYDRGSQWDMTLYSWLWTDFLDIYLKIVREQTYARLDPGTTEALRKEAAAAEAFRDSESEAFQLIQGDPEWPGSSFPYRLGMFGKTALEGDADAAEILLRALMTGENNPGTVSTITDRDVLREYAVFTDRLKEHDFGYLLKERQAALGKEKRAWTEWMAARKDVSARLQGVVKDAFDAATGILCKGRLVLMKNRYNIDDGFCSDSEVRCLASTDWTDDKIIAHDFEKRLNNE